MHSSQVPDDSVPQRPGLAATNAPSLCCSCISSFVIIQSVVIVVVDDDGFGIFDNCFVLRHCLDLIIQIIFQST